MLKHNEVNQLSVFGLRRMEHLPPHFVKVDFTLEADIKVITDWIWEHLEGRFFIGDWYFDNNGLHMQKIAAFESPGEASYFALVLSEINKFNTNF